MAYLDIGDGDFGLDGLVEVGEGFAGVVLELEDVFPAVAVGFQVFDELARIC